MKIHVQNTIPINADRDAALWSTSCWISDCIRSNNWDRTGSCFLVFTLSWFVDWLAIGVPMESSGIATENQVECCELIAGTGWKDHWWIATLSHNWACLSDLKIRGSWGGSLRLNEEYTNEENLCWLSTNW